MLKPALHPVAWLSMFLFAAACGEPSDTSDKDTDIATDTDTMVDTDARVDTDEPAETDETSDTDAAPPCTQALEEPTPGTWLVTSEGCWTVQIHQQTVTLRSPDNFVRIEVWGVGNPEGDPISATAHENLNGKHIKDLLHQRRTILLPDGVIVTMGVTPPMAGVRTVNVYDHDAAWRFDAVDNSLTATAASPEEAASWEAAEANGETSEVVFTDVGGVRWDNIYEEGESEAGEPLPRVEARVPLGETFGPNEPTRVNDYYDDLRLGHS